MGEGELKRIPGIRQAQVACALCALAAAGFVIVQSLCLAFAITELWRGASLDAVALCIVGFFCAFACRLGAAAVQDAIACSFAERATAALQRSYMDALAFAGPALVHRAGQAASVINATDGIASIRDYLVDAVPRGMSLMVVPLCLCIAVAVLDLPSGLITFVCLPFIIIFMRLIGHTASDDSARRHAGFAQMSNHFVDALRGISTLRAFGRLSSYGKTVFAASEGYRRHVMRTLRTATLSSTVLDIFATCGLAAVAIMLGFRMVEGSVLFFPALCVLLLVPEFFMPIRVFARGYHATLEGKSALGAIEEALLFADEEAALEVEYESIESELELKRALEEPGLPSLRLKDVRISYGAGTHVLSHVTLDLSDAHTVVLTGPSGAGKSSLLDVIAGFANPSSGQLVVNGQLAETLKRRDWHRRVAYIPQRPHIFSATLRDNVAFYRPEATDDEVERALGMVGLGWLAEGPHGLELPLGEGGRSLSGGEAHRIALARSLVDPARDVVVLDEPTAHLDIETELALKEALSGVFADRLVIMATHKMHWVEMADVHVMVQDGTVHAERKVPQRDAHEDRMRIYKDDHRRCASALDAHPTPEQGCRNAHAQGNRLLKGLLTQHWPLVAVAIILSFVAAAFACGLMFTSGYMISLAAALPVTVLALHLPSIFVRIFGVGKPLLDYVERLASHDWVLRATSHLRTRIFEAGRRAFDEGRSHRLGEMLATLVEDIKSVQDFFIRCALPYLLAMLVLAGLTVAACAFSLSFGAILFVLLALATVACSVLGFWRGKGVREEERAQQRSLFALLTDDVIGLRDVVLSGRGRERMQKALQERAACEALRRKANGGRRARIFVCQLLVGCAIVVSLLWAAGAFAPLTAGGPFSGDSSPAVGALSGYAAQNEEPYPQNWIAAFAICLFPMIEFLLPATEALLEGSLMRTGIDRLAALIDAKDQDASVAQVFRPDCDSPMDASGSSEELRYGTAVELHIPTLHYPGMTEPALSDITLAIPQGSLTAIIGPSGAGKSTLMRAMAHDLPMEVTGVHTAGRVGLIEQESYLFNKSLRENLLIARGDAADGELEDALSRVGLSGLLKRLPKGLDTVLASGGEDVSGGEATRLAVARALLAGLDIVLLDEPFRALDAETEAAVMGTIQEVLADKTVIVVTHHLQGIDGFDEVIFVEDGRILMQGSPEDLQRVSPRYCSLCSVS